VGYGNLRARLGGAVAPRRRRISTRPAPAPATDRTTEQATDVQPRRFERGFANCDSEFLELPLPVEGRLPRWLSGTLIRNGPARFELAGGRVDHWFDGLAMLHAFGIHDGQVSYSNRFLRTTTYRAARASGKVSYSAFAADPCRTIFKKFFTVLFPRSMDNANVGVAQIAGRFMALTETPMPVEFDLRTLTTLGHVNFKDRIGGSLTTAHPLGDPADGQVFNYLTRFGLPSRYRIFTYEGARRRLVASLAVREPAYMHSFGMTERYVVLSEFPFLFDPAAALDPKLPFISVFRWRPERPSRFLVFDKATGALAGTYESEACFGFHHVNAFEAADGLVVDVIVYDDPSIIEGLYLDTIKRCGTFPTGELRRYHLPFGGTRADHRPLATTGIELPQIDERRRGRPYAFAYGAGTTSCQDFLNRIVKIDGRDGRTTTWSEEDCYPGEPVFVPRPDGTAEDDGIILSVVLDGRRGNSFLLALDAATLEEVGRAAAPHHIPFGFHGMFAADAS
jgi:beta,beta-carotene 9',10'-dioxygenase